MRRTEIYNRASRHNTGWIEVAHAAEVTCANVMLVNGRRDAGPLKELARVGKQIWIIDQPRQVALEQSVIDPLETY